MRGMRDINQDISNFNKLGQATIYTFLLILLITMILAVVTKNRGKCSYAIWQNISFFTIIHWIPLIKIDDYSEFESFFNQISGIFRPFRLPEICYDTSIDIRIYQIINIYSNGFINNSKEELIIYFSVLLICFSIILLEKFSKSEILAQLKARVKYSILIRLHLLIYLDFMTYSMINVYFYTGQGFCSYINLGLSLSFLIMGGCWIMVIPIAIKLKIIRDHESHHDVIFRTIDTLVEEFKPCFQTTKYQYYSIYLLYRFSLSFCLVVLSSSPSVQIFIIVVFQLIICKIYIVFYMICTNPYRHKRDTITVFLSEFLSFVLVFCIGIRSMNSLSEDNRYAMSCICVSLMWITEAVIVMRFILSITSKTYLLQEDINSSPAIVPVTESIIEDNSFEKKVPNLPFNNFMDYDKKLDSQTPMETYKHSAFASTRAYDLDKTERFESPIIENKKEVPKLQKIELASNTFDFKVPKLKKINLASNTFDSYSLNTDSTMNQRNDTRANTISINNSSRYGFRESRSDTVEELKIQEFIKKANKTDIKVGNKGLEKIDEETINKDLEKIDEESLK
jgi:hypothetical protein